MEANKKITKASLWLCQLAFWIDTLHLKLAFSLAVSL